MADCLLLSSNGRIYQIDLPFNAFFDRHITVPIYNYRFYIVVYIMNNQLHNKEAYNCPLYAYITHSNLKKTKQCQVLFLGNNMKMWLVVQKGCVQVCVC